MKLIYTDWSLSVDLDGGRISELTHKSKRILGTYKRLDGKTGNTHICAPSFDKEGQGAPYELPFHGYARTLTWVVEKQTDSSLSISTVTPKTPTYNAELKLVQHFSLGSVFTHSTEVIHLSGSPVPVNIGIHYYWDTPKGWEPVMINNMPQKENIRSNGYMSLLPENTISFPHATYYMQSEGFHSAALWTSFADHNGSKQYNDDFCCIEPIIGWPGYFGTEKSTVKEGQQKMVSIKIAGAGERT